MGTLESRETSLNTRKIVYVDMDNVLVDFKSGLDRVPEEVKAEYANDGKGKPHYDDIPGIFSLMEPLKGAEEAVKKISAEYEVFILTTAPWNNPSAWSDKLEWVKTYLGDVAYKRLILSHHKDLLHGDYLIDDSDRADILQFQGTHIQIGKEPYKDWKAVLDYFKNNVCIE